MGLSVGLVGAQDLAYLPDPGYAAHMDNIYLYSK